MEKLFVQIPKADIALAFAFASRMGWKMERQSDSISRFVAECRKNSTAPITEDDIMEEVRQVRYGE